MTEKQGQMAGKPQTRDRAAEVELAVSRWLRAGVAISGAVILAGLIYFILRGDSGYPEGAYPTALSDIVTGVAALKPFALMMAGLFLLILTPVLRVAISLFVFLAEKDYLYVLLTSFVLLTLVISFFLP
ncbi:Predicted membrane protein [Chlamydia abortus]|nr:Predicted membrane protein [Chlamydia abortus]